ncbi:MAG TPA: ABC transporter permease [Candidatus Acidoferrales bacterium]|nr:ABC transporter permease [Candidatus Acidoferrales bacterium]
MNRLSEFGRRLAMLTHRREFDQGMDDEIRLHLQLREREHIVKGFSPEEARMTVRRNFGNALAAREVSHDSWGWAWLEHLSQDLRFAFRMFAKSPGFTAIAVLTLALGIGANTAIFSVVYGVLLAPLPYNQPSQLVVLNETTPRVGTVSVSYPNFYDWQKTSKSFSQMAIVQDVGFNLGGVSQPQVISGDAVSPSFLSMLGVRPFLGRDFEPSEGKSGTAPVVMLSYSLWKTRFGGDPSVIGRTILLDQKSFTIVGVLPLNYRSPDNTDVLEPIGVWITNNAEEVAERGDRGDTFVIGRLAPGVTFGKASVEMNGIVAELAREYPRENGQGGVALRPMREVFVGDSLQSEVLVLFGAVMFVLLIACANVANLFLVRGAARTKEIALRIAFGASRSRIIRQMLTESLVLACFGGILGVGLAVGGIRGLAALIPMGTLAGATVSLNGMVLLFMGGVVLLAAFLFGLAPAVHSTRPDVQSELKEGTRTTSAGAKAGKLRSMLVITEISLALVLLVGAGLMMKSLYRLLWVDPGFRTAHVMSMEMDLRTQQYSKDPAIRNFWQQVLDSTRVLPGVESASVGTVVPFTGNHSRSDISIEGMALPKPGSYPHPDVHIVSPGYANTLGISLLRGRTFTDADNETGVKVGLINRRLAQQYFPHTDPIGKRFMFGDLAFLTTKNPPEWITIVGVLSDTKLYGLANPSRLEVYLPFRQGPDSHMNLLVKSTIEPAVLISEIRGAVSSVDKDQPIFGIATMNELRSQSMNGRQTTLILLGAFSALALALAAIGIYGVISYSVAQRTHEIGIRMALGAQRKDVLRMVLKQGGKIALIGTVIGIAAAFGLTKLMSSLLFSVSASDPLTFAGVAVLLLLVAMLACYIPARRAVRVDPMIALRYE